MNVNNGCQVAQIGGTKSQGLAIPWHIVAKLIYKSFEFLPLKTGATSPVLTTWCFLRNDMFHLETKKNCGKSLQLLLKRKIGLYPNELTWRSFYRSWVCRLPFPSGFHQYFPPGSGFFLLGNMSLFFSLQQTSKGYVNSLEGTSSKSSLKAPWRDCISSVFRFFSWWLHLLLLCVPASPCTWKTSGHWLDKQNPKALQEIIGIHLQKPGHFYTFLDFPVC